MGNRAGRKRKLGKREPTGRPSRTIYKPTDPTEVGRVARQRVHGLSKTDSETDWAGSVVGRMHLRGFLTRRHLDAAQTIRERRSAYVRALDLRRTEPAAVDLHGSRGAGGADIAPELAARSISRWDELVDALDAAGRKGLLYAVVWSAVIRDQECTEDSGILRRALDVVGDMIGLPLDKPREAA